MHLNEERTIRNTIESVLSNQGFLVKRDFELSKGLFVDMVAFSGGKALLIEIKNSRFPLDQSDLMQVASYANIMKSMRDFSDKEILSCVVAPKGTISSATPYADDLKIHVIKSLNEQKIAEELEVCIGARSLH